MSRKQSCLAALLFLVALFPGCSQSIKDVVISEESETEITRRLPTELTVEEARLLQGYLVRTYPELEEGRLPAGRTLGEMIADQRALERPAAEDETPESDETGDQNPSGVREAAITEQVEPPPPPPPAGHSNSVVRHQTPGETEGAPKFQE